MPEAVIVATGRTPIGRANKGSLVECRPDDLAALVIREVLAKVPQLDPQSVEDVILGSGQPAGEAGYNIGRVAAVLAGLPDVPGVTVNRYCSSSLQTIRMAAHAIKAGEGDVFVAAGVETVSRYMHGAADVGPHNERCSPPPKPGPSPARPRPASPWTPLDGAFPDVYIAMGQTAENVAEYQEGEPRGAGRVRRAVPAPGRGRPGGRLLRPGDHPGHAGRRHRGDQGRRTPAPAPRSRSWPPSTRCSGRVGPSPPATPARSTTAPPPSS